MTQEQQQFIEDVRSLMARRSGYFTTIPEFVELLIARGVTRYTKNGDEMRPMDAKKRILNTFHNENQRNALGCIKLLPGDVSRNAEWLIPNEWVEPALLFEVEKQKRRKARLSQTLRQKANRVKR